MKIKRRIGVDWDDVVVDFHTPLMRYHNALYGTHLKLEDFTTYLFNKVWGGTIEEAVQKVNDFHNSIFFYQILPILDAITSIEILSKENELVVVTSRPNLIRRETMAQADELFRDKFSGIYFSSNHYSNAAGKTKSELCEELNLYSMIDDSLDYIKQCSPIITKGILFGDYPWNQDGKLPENVIRSKNWKDVLEQLK